MINNRAFVWNERGLLQKSSGGIICGANVIVQLSTSQLGE